MELPMIICFLSMEQDCMFEKVDKFDTRFFLYFRPKVPTDGGWSEWGDWSSCGEFCIKNRTRTCTNPLPFAGGANCMDDGSSRLVLPQMTLPTFFPDMSPPSSVPSFGAPQPSFDPNSLDPSGMSEGSFYGQPGMTGMSPPPPPDYGEPEEPDFLPKNTESLQYQFTPCCGEECISKLAFQNNVRTNFFYLYLLAIRSYVGCFLIPDVLTDEEIEIFIPFGTACECVSHCKDSLGMNYKYAGLIDK